MVICLIHKERITHEKKNKRIFNHWWIYDDTDNLCNITNIILEMRLVKNAVKSMVYLYLTNYKRKVII